MTYSTKRYQDKNGNIPYTEWIKKILNKDLRAVAKIDIAINRARAGNFGDHKFERDGVWELRIDYGPGYRIYYAIEDGAIILLLIGGDKGSQQKDLDKAVGYLKDFHARNKQ